jgi:predicted MFS family arabinose efflux permease
VQPPSSISNIGVIPISRILLGVGTGVYLVSTFASVAEIVPTIKIGVYISMVVRI